MADDRRPEAYKVVDERDFALRPARFAYLSKDDYSWIRYPRSGATNIATVCLGIAMGFAITIAGRWLASITAPPKSHGVEPIFAKWELWALAVSSILALVFWLAGRYTSRHTRRAFKRLEAVFYSEE